MGNIAIIPARSKSKGLKDKNIKELCGKPLMAYSIEAAILSRMFDVVMVSTDSEQYAEIARKYGAEVPFLRSDELSNDTASTWDTVDEVLCGYERNNRKFDTVCLLQPTSPLRTSDDIRAAYNEYIEKKAIAMSSVTEISHPLEWCGKLDSSKTLDGFQTKEEDKPRQMLDRYYIENGAIYIFDIEELRKDRFLYRKGAYAYVMPKDRSIDIDTGFDFLFAEFLLRKSEEC